MELSSSLRMDSSVLNKQIKLNRNVNIQAFKKGFCSVLGNKRKLALKNLLLRLIDQSEQVKLHYETRTAPSHATFNISYQPTERIWQAEKMAENYATEKGFTEAKAGWSQIDTRIQK